MPFLPLLPLSPAPVETWAIEYPLLPKLSLTYENMMLIETATHMAGMALSHYTFKSSCSLTVPDDSWDDESTDSASVFSVPTSDISHLTVPEDEAQPYFMTDAAGFQIEVYASLDQAVRHSLMRIEAERAREEELGISAAFDEDDEDAYFSMG